MAASVSNMKKKKQNVMKSMIAIRLLRSVTTGRGSVSVTDTLRRIRYVNDVKGTVASLLQWRFTILNPFRREEAMTLLTLCHCVLPVILRLLREKVEDGKG
jgi:hypothetical protein